METVRREYIPFRPVHPGEILKDELEYRKISQKKFAETLGLSYTALNEILNSKRPVSTDFALMVEHALGVNSGLLLRMQLSYNLQVAQKDNKLKKYLEKISKLSAAACF
ncbi:MAG: HigA family addiction module antitoxin [Bacteroidetes bacterium]|nr:HigA family addiction module antitoxin [Bacteroidota bacterium]